MNDRFIHERAVDFSTRIAAASGDDQRRLEAAFLVLYARPPEPEELKLATAYLTNYPARDKAWQSISRALLSSNEFIYLD